MMREFRGRRLVKLSCSTRIRALGNFSGMLKALALLILFIGQERAAMTVIVVLWLHILSPM